MSVCLSVCVSRLYSLNGWADFDFFLVRWFHRRRLTGSIWLLDGWAVSASTAQEEHWGRCNMGYSAVCKSLTLIHPGLTPQWCFVSSNSIKFLRCQCFDGSLLPGLLFYQFLAVALACGFFCMVGSAWSSISWYSRVSNKSTDGIRVPDSQNTPKWITVPGSNSSTRLPISRNEQFYSNIISIY